MPRVSAREELFSNGNFYLAIRNTVQGDHITQKLWLKATLARATVLGRPWENYGCDLHPRGLRPR